MDPASPIDTPSPNDPAARTAALRTEGARLIEAAAGDLEAPISSCAGWTAADLLGHVSGVWEAFRAIVESASTDAPDFATFTPTPDDHGELVAFATDRLDALVAAIGASDPSLPSWSWTGQTTLGFYGRRALHETVVHRIDAELGAGHRTPVDPAVAFDGVDELYSALLAGASEGLPSGSLHLHQTDGDGELMLQVVDGSISVTHEHAKGDAALRASGEELLLACWGRRSLDGLELFGDQAVADAWLALGP